MTEEELSASTSRALRVVVAVVACSFLAGAIGYFLGVPQDPGGDSVEVGFLQDMITHHDQAVTMSLLELDNGTDPITRSYAREIVLFQRYEIGRMDESLRRWGANGDRPELAMGWMGEAMPVAEMPGLATDEQMDELRSATGADADALFLQLMITHHRAGVEMAQYAVDHAGDHGIRDLAQVMVTNQTKEIAELSGTAEDLSVAVPEPEEHEGHDGHGG